MLDDIERELVEEESRVSFYTSAPMGIIWGVFTSVFALMVSLVTEQEYKITYYAFMLIIFGIGLLLFAFGLRKRESAKEKLVQLRIKKEKLRIAYL